MDLASRYRPGNTSAENEQRASEAADLFDRILLADPNQSTALASRSWLHFQKKEWAKAEEGYVRLLKLDPQDAITLYTLGVIAWTRCFERRRDARAALGMSMEDPGPIRCAAVRSALQTELLPVIAAGIDRLERALSINPTMDNAMAYLNLLYREKADLQDSNEAYQEHLQVADRWVARCARRRNA